MARLFGLSPGVLAVVQERGEVHSARRFGQPLELVATKGMPDIRSARIFEREPKANKKLFPSAAIVASFESCRLFHR
jgi:hypothetical protein